SPRIEGFDPHRGGGRLSLQCGQGKQRALPVCRAIAHSHTAHLTVPQVGRVAQMLAQAVEAIGCADIKRISIKIQQKTLGGKRTLGRISAKKRKAGFSGNRLNAYTLVVLLIRVTTSDRGGQEGNGEAACEG